MQDMRPSQPWNEAFRVSMLSTQVGNSRDNRRRAMLMPLPDGIAGSHERTDSTMLRRPSNSDSDRRELGEGVAESKKIQQVSTTLQIIGQSPHAAGIIRADWESQPEYKLVLRRRLRPGSATGARWAHFRLV